MGFSTSGATAIIFVGFLIAVGIAFPVLETAHDRRVTAMEDRDQRALDVRNTDVTVNSTVYNETTDRLIVEVRNVGSTTLSVSGTDLLVDGAYRDGYETTVDGVADRDQWHPGEVLTMNASVEVAPTRVKIVTENGIAQTVFEDDIETETG